MFRKTGIVCLGLVATALVAGIAAADEQTAQVQTDRLLIEAQRICPVTGKDLQSMGGPVKAEVGGATVFLCCKDCFGKPLNKEHWSKLQDNIADAQGLCPIFKKPLGQHPVSVVVQNRMVFVCCSPCTAKVKADAKAAIAFVDAQLAENLK